MCSLLHGLWARSGMLPRSCSITIWITPGRGEMCTGSVFGVTCMLPRRSTYREGGGLLVRPEACSLWYL